MEAESDGLGRAPLFRGLAASDLHEIRRSLRSRRFQAREVICQAGEPGDSLFLIVDGLADCFLPDLDAESRRSLAKLRGGDVIGELALITGEPRSATVVAAVPTTVLELGRETFDGLVADHPVILANLNRILTRRLMHADQRDARQLRRGEAVLLILGPSLEGALPRLVSAASAASVAAVASLEAQPALEHALPRLDELLVGCGTVLMSDRLDAETVPLLLQRLDRSVAIVADGDEARRLGALMDEQALGERTPDVVLVAEPGAAPPATVGQRPVTRVLRCERSGIADRDLAWLGRHLTRTKLGLALGAGGAKGYAHVGAIHELEAAGYTVDYVAGSSIGAVVGAFLSLGMGAAQIEAVLRGAFTPDAVAEIFKMSFSGRSAGLATMTRILREGTAERSFRDCVIPLVVMAVDLAEREPAPLRDGPLWEALLAATALAGIFPPHQRDGRRLVDGLALVPVPTECVVEEGADIVVAVNLMSRDTLPAWPGEGVPAPAPDDRGPRMLDALLEVMDLSQLDASIRHAAKADVVVTPRFGPATWRDFARADLFLAAGRRAAVEQMPSLRALAAPTR